MTDETAQVRSYDEAIAQIDADIESMQGVCETIAAGIERVRKSRRGQIVGLCIVGALALLQISLTAFRPSQWEWLTFVSLLTSLAATSFIAHSVGRAGGLLRSMQVDLDTSRQLLSLSEGFREGLEEHRRVAAGEVPSSTETTDENPPQPAGS